VIALMLAQRFPDTHIHAVEIDQQAAETAEKNFQFSVFSERLTINHTSIEQYEYSQQFDLIVSNPPFFVNDLKNEEFRKGIARHAEKDFFSLLIEKSNSLLADGGLIWLILPIKKANEVVSIAAGYGLLLVERIYIHSDQSKVAFRQVICLKKGDAVLKEWDFNIYASLKQHTAAYQELLKDFFLAF
jgi:tRNA1Val (adenine37-N6)-methyltransferase